MLSDSRASAFSSAGDSTVKEATGQVTQVGVTDVSVLFEGDALCHECFSDVRPGLRESLALSPDAGLCGLPFTNPHACTPIPLGICSSPAGCVGLTSCPSPRSALRTPGARLRVLSAVWVGVLRKAAWKFPTGHQQRPVPRVGAKAMSYAALPWQATCQSHRAVPVGGLSSLAQQSLPENPLRAAWGSTVSQNPDL